MTTIRRVSSARRATGSLDGGINDAGTAQHGGGFVRLREGTTAEWAAANPVLAVGEIGVDLTLNVMRRGDGVSTWSALSNMGGGLTTADLAETQAGVIATKAVTPSSAAGTYPTFDEAIFESQVFS